jgi:4-aminobutyrate aminotransferase-like enzyme
LLARANVLGGRLRTTLEGLQNQVPQIAEVRGLGAMIGVEFCQPSGNTPHPDFAKQVQARALERGLLMLTCGVYANVIRFMFPLTMSDAIMAEGLEILRSAVLETAVK